MRPLSTSRSAPFGPAAMWALLGAGGGAAIVVGAAPTTLRPVQTPVTTWLGWLPQHSAARMSWPDAGLVLLGLLALSAAWIVLLQAARAGALSRFGVGAGFAAFAAPFVIGPPLFSGDIYAYIAQGLEQAHGLNPYAHGPAALGELPIVAAVDPTWRDAPSPYGPVSQAIAHGSVAVSGGSVVTAIFLLRVVAVLAVLIGALGAARLADPGRARAAFVLVALNPVAILFVVSGAHFDALLGALLVGALVRCAAAPRGRNRAAALTLAVAAAAVKITGVVGLPFVLLAGPGIGRSGRRRPLLMDALVLAGAVALVAVVAAHPLGWVANLKITARASTNWAPSHLVAVLIRPLVDSAMTARTVAATLCATAAALVTIGLLLTRQRRATAESVGLALLAFAVSGAAIFAWYFLPAITVLAGPMGRSARAVETIVLGSLVVTLLGLDKLPTPLVVPVMVVVLGVGGWRQRPRRSAPTTSVPVA